VNRKSTLRTPRPKARVPIVMAAINTLLAVMTILVGRHEGAVVLRCRRRLAWLSPAPVKDRRSASTFGVHPIPRAGHARFRVACRGSSEQGRETDTASDAQRSVMTTAAHINWPAPLFAIARAKAIGKGPGRQPDKTRRWCVLSLHGTCLPASVLGRFGALPGNN
jgi:hypothetical protein